MAGKTYVYFNRVNPMLIPIKFFSLSHMSFVKKMKKVDVVLFVLIWFLCLGNSVYLLNVEMATIPEHFMTNTLAFLFCQCIFFFHTKI